MRSILPPTTNNYLFRFFVCGTTFVALSCIISYLGMYYFGVTYIICFDKWRDKLPNQVRLTRAEVMDALRAFNDCSTYNSRKLNGILLLVLSQPNSTSHRTRLRASFMKSNYSVVFVLSRSENTFDQHLVGRERQDHDDIVQGNFGQQQDVTVGVFFGLSMVSRCFRQFKYVMALKDETLVNAVPLVNAFKSIEMADDGKSIFGYVRSEYEHIRQDNLNLVQYLDGGAVVYPVALVDNLLSGGIKLVGCSATKDAFFSGLVATHLGINLKHIASFDAFCNLPTVCNSAPVLMNCFGSVGQCAN